ncbi:MAG: hypothetical protein HAW58_06600 [Candidatus Thioglobus sp.]|nr:hypothetical protein [Candidatus Thioglobus sp.]
MRCIRDASILVSISSLSISANSVAVGGSLTLTADFTPTDTNQRDIEWTISAGSGSATLTGNILTGVAVGEVTVVATSAADSSITASQSFNITPESPANLQAVANGQPNRVTVFWSAVAGASGYKLYQSTTDLANLAGGDAGNLSVASPTTIETAEVGVNLSLTNADKNYFLVTATVNGVESATNATQAVATANSQEFGTVSGGTANTPTSTVWMDRNLGAERVATSTTDTMAFGDYYQWGRPADEHQLESSGTRNTLAANITPNHAEFIRSTTSPFDWTASGVDTDGSARSAIWSRIDGSGVCPTGFRVPINTELEAERTSWASNNSAGAFASNLKWSAGGTRLNSGGLSSVGTDGHFWAANNSGNNWIQIGGSAATLRVLERAYGNSVRCIRDASITAVPVIQIPPVAPATLQAVANGTANQVTVFWSAVSGATGYKLYQSADDLSANEGGTPPTATITETTEVGINITLTGADKNYFLVTAINAAGESLTNATQAIATANSQVFATVSSTTNRVWMDRNLGASRVANSRNDSDAYGGYYQWGRLTDGHQLKTSPTNGFSAPNITVFC